MLRKFNAGVKTADPVRRCWLSEAMSYNWKTKYRESKVSEVGRLRAFESPNAKLK